MHEACTPAAQPKPGRLAGAPRSTAPEPLRMSTASPDCGVTPCAAAASASSHPCTGSPGVDAVGAAQPWDVVEHAAGDDAVAPEVDRAGVVDGMS